MELTPFVVARAEAGERQPPAWMEVIPDKMRILVHALPVRAQIDTLVQEQLIVEYTRSSSTPARPRPAAGQPAAMPSRQSRDCHIAGSAERK